MSSSGTDRQGQIGDLKKQSKQELAELLLRQEKILCNKRFLQTLPDKGQKIRDFAEKVRVAVEQHDEEERRRGLVSDARTQFQTKYQQAFTMQQRPVHDDTATSSTDSHQDRQSVALSSEGTTEADLVEAMDTVTLSEASSGPGGECKEPSTSTATQRDNYFLKTQIPKKPHYVTVLERSETAEIKHKFKPNQLALRSDVSASGSSSPGSLSEGSSPLSVQARRDRDRKHLDDMTAARMPPLHHSPAQLLSLEESAGLLQEQTRKQQELQAKQAAQKLSAGLKVSMGRYTPEGGPAAAYREVHDEGARHSSDED